MGWLWGVACKAGKALGARAARQGEKAAAQAGGAWRSSSGFRPLPEGTGGPLPPRRDPDGPSLRCKDRGLSPEPPQPRGEPLGPSREENVSGIGGRRRMSDGRWLRGLPLALNYPDMS